MKRWENHRAGGVLFLVLLLLLIVLGTVSVLVESQTIIKNLPGYDGELPFTLETGYVGVGYKEEVKLFYYFIESERKPGDDPLLLWITGGPGCSGFSALAYEIGPLIFNYTNTGGTTFLLNPYSWSKVANVIFLDTPVGTGFSYATSAEGYNIGDLSSASQAYEFLRKWLLNHPKFLSNPVYIAGGSYSGIPVPAVVQEISDGNDKGWKPPLNLKGLILYNPLTHLKYDINSRIEFAHDKALISDELYESTVLKLFNVPIYDIKSTKESCKSEYVFMYPDRSNELCVRNAQAINESLGKLYAYNILEPKCNMWDLRHLLQDDSMGSSSTPQILEEWCREYNLVFSNIWANDKNVQNALHVQEGTIKRWERCNTSLNYKRDIRSSLEYHRNLTKKVYRSLIFSGDHDLVLPYLGTHEWIQSLKLSVDDDWQPWFVDDQVAGFVIEYSKGKYKLTFATVKGAGHTATEYKPKECLAMIDRWLAKRNLNENNKKFRCRESNPDRLGESQVS